MNHGKNICNQLKEIRRNIAIENGIALEIPECTYQGDCDGTCPRCEAELQYLERELTLRAVMGKTAVVAGLALCFSGGTLTASAQNVTTNHQDSHKTLSNTGLSASDTCIFKGSIIDSRSGEPLIGANILLKNKAGEIVSGARTDFDGKFTLCAPKGEYEVERSCLGYFTDKTTFNLNSDTLSIGAFVMVRSGKTVLGAMPVIVGMPRTPVIEIGASENGEIIDADRIQHFPR